MVKVSAPLFWVRNMKKHSYFSLCATVLVYLNYLRLGSVQYVPARSTSAVSVESADERTGGLAPVHPSPAWNFNASEGFSAVDEIIHDADTLERHRAFHRVDDDRRTVFFVTPTYYRHTQFVDLTRLAQTLMHDQAVYWIVVEDARTPSARVRDLLHRTGLPFAHVAAPTRVSTGPKDKVKGMGVPQRNRALDIIESMTTTTEHHEGVIFFGDDDNAYDIRLFDQIRQTKRVAASGVGFGTDMYERCRAKEDGSGTVAQLISNASKPRKFKIDMAGFAFTTQVLREKRPRFSDRWGGGMQETNFMEQLVDEVEDLEALDNCEKIYAWHVRTIIKKEIAKRVRRDPQYELLKATI